MRKSPPAARGEWTRNPIDAFVLAKMQAHKLSPTRVADRRKLIRRVHLIMLGLPPTPADVEAFVSDARPDAYERLIDRILASPQYGERWARHWLDVVRFAETDGFETNRERPTAWHYRDYVIGSLNGDTPYDNFVKEQLCGDTINVDAATGFLVAGPHDIVKSPDITLTLMQRQDELADMVNTTGTTFLGLTLGCARCHNHKFDPIQQRDYYALQAVFAGVQHGERELRTDRTSSVFKQMEELRAQRSPLQESLDEYVRKARQLHLVQHNQQAGRPRVNSRLNEDSFEPTMARYLRFTIRSTNTGSEPCLDELEVLTPDNKNVSLASTGAVPRASGTLPGYDIHQLEHINDGRTGNSHSWISDTPGRGWIEIEFPQIVSVNRIRWGRDRQQQFRDRTPIDYRSRSRDATWSMAHCLRLLGPTAVR